MRQLERMLLFFDKSNLEAPTEPTEDPNLFSELVCKVLALGETFGVRSQCVYLWVGVSAKRPLHDRSLSGQD
jgi:hypothetical protein